MAMTYQERKTLLMDLDICTRLGGCTGCSRTKSEGIACAQELMAKVRESIRSAPAWSHAANEPKQGDPYMLEPDLQIRESKPVLCLTDDGRRTVGRLMTETDPNDPDYRWHGWILEDSGDPLEGVAWWMPLPEGPELRGHSWPEQGEARA